MKLINKTHWRSDHIMAFVKRVAEAELDPPQRKGYVVEVGYTRRRGVLCTGYAYYHSKKIWVNVPSDNILRDDLAHVIAHEMAHTRGMRHRAMRGSARYQRVPGYAQYYAWANELPLEQVQIERVPRAVRTAAKRDKKLEQAQAALARWERRAKLAATKLKVWRRKVRRLEATIAQAAERSS